MEKNKDKRFYIEAIKENFNTMKFDMVIGTPPYINDLYLDFVTLGHKMSSKYTIMITSAKWQAKGGAKNEQFEKRLCRIWEK